MEDSLQESGFAVIEMGGVQPNPRMGFVRDTIDWVRDQGIRAVVAVGGGSVIDTAKAVAAGLEYEGMPGISLPAVRRLNGHCRCSRY